MGLFSRHLASHFFGLAGALFVNRSESKVLPYTLPPILGSITEEEVRALFQYEVYGVMPETLPDMSAGVVEEGEAFNGTASRKQIALTLSRGGRSATLNLLIYIPKGMKSYPAILASNFDGNYSVSSDGAVLATPVWSRRFAGTKRVFHERNRNKHANRLPVEVILEQGYAVVTFCYGDADPDYDDGFKNGVHALYPELQSREDNWASVGAWAWSFSRVLDFLQTEKEIDANRVALYGFSRLGKASLWAGACDSRFGAILCEGSGKGGVSLSRRNFGESLHLINLRFPHWFSKSFHGYAQRPQKLLVDQHMLMALMAPRPLLVSVGKDDWWSDPEGTKLALQAVEEKAGKSTYLYEHEGTHEPRLVDWGRYLDFLDAEMS
ncbi:MAG: acetylxylan esterase [Patescibacteria group bacterium]